MITRQTLRKRSLLLVGQISTDRSYLSKVGGKERPQRWEESGDFGGAAEQVAYAFNA